MHEAGLLFPPQEAGEEGREPHVAGVIALPMAAGTPLIRGRNSSLVNCEISRPLTALEPSGAGTPFHSWNVPA